MPYVFYDTETTGTETPFDQILQFAAIRTDDALNELERFNIRCRLLPHIIPSPKALLITQVTPTILTDPDLPSHYTMIRQIRDTLLAWSPATFIGFNSMSFDEDLLRQALFQTLHPAYLTNTNRNARSDVLRMAHAASVYAPDAIVVPTDDRGRQVFRLDRLAPANGYDHGDAHEAMADIEATIFVARLIRNRAPNIWNVMDRATTKNAVIANVETEALFTLTENYFGRNYSWLVTPCGQNPNDTGQLSVFDLAFDPDGYRRLSAEDLVAVLNAKPKVIRSLRANRQPIMMPADAAPDGTAALQIPPDERRRRVEVIQGAPDFQARVGQAQALRFADRGPAGICRTANLRWLPERDGSGAHGRVSPGGLGRAVCARSADRGPANQRICSTPDLFRTPGDAVAGPFRRTRRLDSRTRVSRGYKRAMDDRQEGFT